MMVIMDRLAKKVHAWTDMIIDGVNFTDPSQGTFINANMRANYEGPGSHQWIAKFIDDIAWVYNNVCSRYWEKFATSYTFYPDGDGSGRDEAYFDATSGRDYNGKLVFFYESDTYDAGDSVLLTASYQNLLGGALEVKSLSGGGFQLHNKLGIPLATRFLVEVIRWVPYNT